MQTRICDRCKKEIVNVFATLEFVKQYPNYSRDPIDLCDDCKKSFDEFMKGKKITLQTEKKIEGVLGKPIVPRVVLPKIRPSLPSLSATFPKGITRLMGSKATTLKEPYTPARAKKFRDKK